MFELIISLVNIDVFLIGSWGDWGHLHLIVQMKFSVCFNDQYVKKYVLKLKGKRTKNTKTHFMYFVVYKAPQPPSPPHLQITELVFIWNIFNDIFVVKLHANSELLYSQIAYA